MKHEERRQMVNVEDKSTEASVRLNNILTFLVLGVMSWVGWNIQEMRKDIAESQLETAIIKQQISYFKERLYDHMANNEVHYHASRKD